MIFMPLLLAATVGGPANIVPPGARTFIRDDLKLARYQAAAADLNRDGSPEVIVYATDPGSCGSGGCNLYVLTSRGRSYRVVTRTTVTRKPIRVLPTSSQGWRDLAVQVSGGGLGRPYTARLRFDGRTYPTNPTLLAPLQGGRAAGRVLID